MARPKINGLYYIPLDVDFFSDRKIKRLKARYGTDGVVVYLYLICEIYRSGYYIDYSDDLILDISDELNISENATRQIIDFLLSRSLFDNTLAKSDKVLTAASVQRRYQEAKKGSKREFEVEARYWLLKAEDTYSFIKVRHNYGYSKKNHSYSEKNPNKSEKNPTKESKVNKSKENKSKVKESIKPDGAKQKPTRHKYGEYNHVLLTDEQYTKLIADFSEQIVKDYIRRVDEYCQQYGKSYNDYNLTIRNWLRRDGKNAENKRDDSSAEKRYGNYI